MKRIILILFVVLPFLLSSCGGSKKTVGSKKAPNSNGIFTSSQTLTSILEEAQEEGKIVFVDMYTTWCAPCKVMDEEVYTHQSVHDLFKDKVISYKVDAEKANGPDLALIYNVQVYPTLLFLDDKGREIVRSDGALSTTGFLDLARLALDQQNF